MHAPEVRKNGSSNRELDEGRSVKLLMFGLHEHMPSFVILRMIVIARILARFDFSRGLSFNFCPAAGRAFLIDARCLSELFRLCFVAFFAHRHSSSLCLLRKRPTNYLKYLRVARA